MGGLSSVGEEIYKLKQDGRTNDEIAEQFGIHERTVRAYASAYAKENGLPFPLRVNQSNSYVRRVAPSDFVAETTRKHRKEFAKKLDWMYKSQELIRVAVPNDLHIPHHDTRACDVFLQVVKDFQPDVIVDGSDVFDFSTISHWRTSVKESCVDVWNESLPHYISWREQVRAAAPGALSFFLEGNHDSRLRSFFEENVPQFSESMVESYVKEITGTGTLWLDWDMVEIGGLLLTHGTFAGASPAKSMFNSYGYNYRVSIAGHVHRQDLFERTSHFAVNGKAERRNTCCLTTGCLCNLSPSYDKSLKGFNWSLGFALAVVNTRTGIVHVENLKIDAETYSTIWGGKIYAASS